LLSVLHDQEERTNKSAVRAKRKKKESQEGKRKHDLHHHSIFLQASPFCRPDKHFESVEGREKKRGQRYHVGKLLDARVAGQGLWYGHADEGWVHELQVIRLAMLARPSRGEVYWERLIEGKH
jgi:hypothetical protein